MEENLKVNFLEVLDSFNRQKEGPSTFSLSRGELKVEIMGRGFAWLDTGTHESLIEDSNYIKMIERRQGLKVACLEVIACKMGYISTEQLLKLAESLKKSGYGQYLFERAKEL